MQADAKRDLPGPEQPQFHAASPPSAPSTSTQQQAGLRDVPTTAENVGRKHNTKYDNYAKTDHEIFRALHLFSGRSDRKDGLATLLRAQGWECEDIDIVNASLPGEQRSDHDLLDDELWLSIRKWLLDGEYDFVWLGTPCATFSAARWQIIPGNPNAPRSLRDFCYPWGYNGPTVDDDTIPHLTTKEKEDLKQGNIFAQKSAEIFELRRSLGIPVALENPSPRPDNLSLFDLEIYKSLAEDQHTHYKWTSRNARTDHPPSNPPLSFTGGQISPNSTGDSVHTNPDLGHTHSGTGRQRLRGGNTHLPLVNSSAKGKASTAAAAAYPAALNKQISTIISSTKRKHVPLPGNSDNHFPSKRVPKLHFEQP